ncbi:unnamed protein product [Cochlearia groenlandica]
MQIAKGKGLAGTSKFRAIRNLRPVNAERERQENQDDQLVLNLLGKMRELLGRKHTVLFAAEPTPLPAKASTLTLVISTTVTTP